MLCVKAIDIRLINMQTRLPFRYGIATLLACPHLFLRLTVEVDGQVVTGTAADQLPPKWFTKDPDTAFANDVADMLDVIGHAADHSILAGPAPDAYTLISRVYNEQTLWSNHKHYPPLLSQFGLSLVERCVIEAVCRAKQTNFAAAVRSNLLGVRFSGYPDEQLMLDLQELGDSAPSQWLPPNPLDRVFARHTVGLIDPLTEADISPSEKVSDGLPQALDACIRYYGLSRLKIKLSGDIAKDLDRLKRVFALARQAAPPDWAYTLDGNENFKAVAPFRELWEGLQADSAIRADLHRLIFVEQPMHRSVALSAEVGKEFAAWPDRPPIIIDESDGYPAAFADALSLGYAGTSHKNCKGVIKSIANASLYNKRRLDNPAARIRLSGEDLINTGPVALQQDLAVCAALGINDIERNGHHYFRGLSMHPQSVQQQILEHQPDLYHPHPQGGFPTLSIQAGQLNMTSINAAPLGVPFELDFSNYTPLREWKFEGVEKR